LRPGVGNSRDGVVGAGQPGLAGQPFGEPNQSFAADVEDVDIGGAPCQVDLDDGELGLELEQAVDRRTAGPELGDQYVERLGREAREHILPEVALIGGDGAAIAARRGGEQASDALPPRGARHRSDQRTYLHGRLRLQKGCSFTLHARKRHGPSGPFSVWPRVQRGG
jgi:hypothetical protein